VLCEQESFDVLHRVILPTARRRRAAPSRRGRCRWAARCGEDAEGKKRIADLVQTALDQCGGAVRVCRDLYKPAHRHYPGLLAANVRTVGVLVRPDTARWQAAVEARVRDRRFDAVVESALADPDDFRGSSLAYRAAVHRIEVVVVTAEALSQLGIVDRLLSEAVNGGGRLTADRRWSTAWGRQT
jgi:hypothetical protein